MANEFKKFAKSLDKFVTVEARKAGLTAINRAMASTKTEAVRSAAQATGAKQKDIKNRIGQFKANIKRISGAVIAFAKPISLSVFTPKVKVVRTKKGRRYGATIKGPEGRQLVPGGFIVEGKSRVSVFARVGMARLPIKKLFTNALIKHISQAPIIRQLTEKATREFEKQWANELKRRKLTQSDS